ncbi:MAG: UDP-N-acetylmuramate--L-alanine ligase, partial [Bacteroidales bacterium]|nr:UDP-N-acetylmuramate--L-alanine ligase [Bacteroidales bacterium]
GISVSGYDRVSTPLTSELQNEGINIHFEDNPKLIPVDIDLVVYTPAIPSELKEFQFIRKEGTTLQKRSEVLENITQDYYTIAVAGTHGKTSIASMISHILKENRKNVTAFIGGIMSNYDSNFLFSEKCDYMVVEADEFDRSFLKLKPSFSVISAMDSDHLDIYLTHEELKNTFQQFAANTKENGKLLVNSKLKEQISYSGTKILYSVSEDCDYTALNILPGKHDYIFNIRYAKGRIDNIRLQMPGKHNVENALAAAAIALNLGISAKDIKQALESYKGVKRRFEYRIKHGETIFIDDYAHHPEEIHAFVEAVKNLYPSKKISGIFQPHLYSRTRDFAEEFAKSLSLLDEIILLDIYPAREKPIEGVSSKIIFDRIGHDNKVLLNKEELLNWIGNKKFEVLATIGAGDIDQLVEPIEKILMKR